MRLPMLLAAGLVLASLSARADTVPAPDPLPQPNRNWIDDGSNVPGVDREERRDGSRRPREMFRSSGSTLRVRVIDAAGLTRVFPEDEVLVVRSRAQVTLELPPVMSGVEGRLLVIKSAVEAGDTVVVRDTDVGDLTLEPGQSVTLVSCSQLRDWLVISRGP